MGRGYNMFKIKKYIYNLCNNNVYLKKLYTYISYIKGKILYGFKLALPIIIFKKVHKHSIFLIFTPEHANLGDHAIAFSEIKILEKNKFNFFEITGKSLYILHQYKYLSLLDGSFILVNGGGNLGMLWPEIEKMNRIIISTLTKSVIFILPNSIYYENSYGGNRQLAESREIYNKHKLLHLYARENISFEIMKKNYCNVKLVPDMVLLLNYSHYNYNRHGCILCLRNDIEKTLSKENTDLIVKKINQIFKGDISFSSTLLNYNVNRKNRKYELEKKFKEFASASLVITDRLHGMIFCAITGTKCIVLNSKSPKMIGCYKWIKHLNYIKFVNDIDSIIDAYQDMPSYPFRYNNNDILKMFKILEQDIKRYY